MKRGAPSNKAFKPPRQAWLDSEDYPSDEDSSTEAEDFDALLVSLHTKLDELLKTLNALREEVNANILNMTDQTQPMSPQPPQS